MAGKGACEAWMMEMTLLMHKHNITLALPTSYERCGMSYIEGTVCMVGT